jgi:hypothetical protein
MTNASGATFQWAGGILTIKSQKFSAILPTEAKLPISVFQDIFNFTNDKQ